MTNIFSAQGRSGRVHFLLVNLVCMAMAFAGADVEQWPESVAMALTLPFLAMLWVFVVAHIRRCHDLDRTGWLALLILVPLLNILLSLYLLLAPGSDGANAYG